MNRTPSMRRRHHAAQQQQDRWVFLLLACSAFAALLFVDSGEEQEPVITSQAHRDWVAELCTRTTDEAEIRQCKKFLEAK